MKTSSICLQCHGNSSKKIEIATMATLRILHPEDKAVNYDVNGARGVLSISWDKKR
ncbi:hypothetical protein [uncultured Maribacter sp.]|uniref:hypothetical protein n=1 Tax=uncultured Maribacter sp. TaxID=431308 RepID=UPI00261E7C76|nr:hypothetical protein [uncultured Maribacter sp.]